MSTYENYGIKSSETGKGKQVLIVASNDNSKIAREIIRPDSHNIAL